MSASHFSPRSIFPAPPAFPVGVAPEMELADARVLLVALGPGEKGGGASAGVLTYFVAGVP